MVTDRPASVPRGAQALAVAACRRREASVLVAALILLGAAMVWVTGGTHLAYLHLLYIPVVLGGLTLGLPGGLAAGAAVGLALGPLMPLDVAAGTAQPAASWLLRLLAFVGVGALVGLGQRLVHARLHDTQALLDAEQRLRYAQQHAHDLAQLVLEDGARERNRLALHVHDEVVPELVAASHQNEAGLTSLACGDVDAAVTRFEKARAVLDDGVARCRQLLDELRRSVLEPGTLCDALAEIVHEHAEAHDLHADLDAPGAELCALPLPVELLVYHTVRNALGNVARHADASMVTVCVRRDDGHIACEIADDGRGFDPFITPAGHGLDLLTQRWHLAGGGLTVDSVPGQGTTVRARLPLAGVS